MPTQLDKMEKEFDELQYQEAVRFVLSKMRAKLGDVAIDDMLDEYKQFLRTSHQNLLSELKKELPGEKQMRGSNCSCHINAPCSSCENMTGEDVGFIDGHNAYRASVISIFNKYMGEEKNV